MILLLVIAVGPGSLRAGPCLTLGFALVGTTTVASGLQYVRVGDQGHHRAACALTAHCNFG